MILTNRCPLEGQPEIEYPCIWEYKVFGEDCALLVDCLKEACHPHKTEINHSRSSSSGKYHSMKAVVEVPSEEVRVTIFEQLKQASAVKFIL
ncbi:MAG: DUF493 domain-containing protein [Desulforhopalus sp.]|nr:DUF493 domain-containing protein [Desulforhopalus sp.]